MEEESRVTAAPFVSRIIDRDDEDDGYGDGDDDDYGDGDGDGHGYHNGYDDGDGYGYDYGYGNEEDLEGEPASSSTEFLAREEDSPEQTGGTAKMVPQEDNSSSTTAKDWMEEEEEEESVVTHAMEARRPCPSSLRRRKVYKDGDNYETMVANHPLHCDEEAEEDDDDDEVLSDEVSSIVVDPSANSSQRREIPMVAMDSLKASTEITSTEITSSSSSSLIHTSQYKEEDKDKAEKTLPRPFALVTQILGFQLKIIAYGLWLFISFFRTCYSLVSQAAHQTTNTKEKATEIITQKLATISQIPPKASETGAIVAKKTAWGCLAATYTCLILTLLLFPAFFFNFLLMSVLVEEPVHITETLHFDYTQSHPSAVIFLHPFPAYGKSKDRLRSQTNKIFTTRPIPVHHKICLTVILTLPESDYNRNLGMFQLTGELLSKEGEVLEVASRPCILKFRSALIRWATTFLKGLPLLAGIAGESQKITVPLMEFREQFTPTSGVRILLQPKAGHLREGGLPELYSAVIQLQSQLPWLKQLVYKWKWTFYVWSGLSLYLVEIALLLCCCRQVLMLKALTSGFEGNNSGKPETSTRGKEDPSRLQEEGKTRTQKRVSFEDNSSRQRD